MMNDKKILILSLVGLLLGVGAGFVVRSYLRGSDEPSAIVHTTNETEHPFNASALVPPQPVADFFLTNHNEGLTHLSDYEGEVVVLFFGYTYCPDICPANLANMAQVREQLGDAGKNVQILMVTADPKRDTPAALKKYVTNFDDSFLGLTGSEEELQTVYDQFGIFVEIEEDANSDDYLVGHTAGAMVIDQAGQWRLLIPFGMTIEQIQADLTYLLENPA